MISLRCSMRDLQSFHHLVLFFFLSQHRKHNLFHTILSHPETMDFTFPLFWGIRGSHPFHPFADLQVLHSNAHRLDPPSLQVLQHASTDRPFVKPARQNRSRGPTAVAKVGLSCSTIGHSIGFLQADDQPWIDWSSQRNALPHDGMLCCYGKLWSGLSKGQEAKYMLSPTPSSSGSGSCSSICCSRQLAKSCKLERYLTESHVQYLTQPCFTFYPSPVLGAFFIADRQQRLSQIAWSHHDPVLGASGSRSSTLWGFFNLLKTTIKSI